MSLMWKLPVLTPEESPGNTWGQVLWHWGNCSENSPIGGSSKGKWAGNWESCSCIKMHLLAVLSESRDHCMGKVLFMPLLHPSAHIICFVSWINCFHRLR